MAGKMVDNLIGEFLERKIAIALVGPTAIGKTNLSLSLSDVLPVEIVSADSRQIYKYLDIGTAKPTLEERSRVPHHFIDICYPDEYYSAGQYGKDANAVVNEIFNRGKIPLIVGGSGLYVKALCEGFFEEGYTSSEKNKALKIRRELSCWSRDALYSRLMEVDPETAKLYPDKNYVRLLRALEFYEVKGVPISVYRKTFHRKPDFTTIYIGLIAERKQIYSLIENRVEKMWNDGLVVEVKNILDMGYSPELNSLNTVGYKETIDFLQGRIDANTAIELIKQNTRRYAKRQITWFKKNNQIRWFDAFKDNLLKNILDFLNQKIESFVTN
jgi:tRNA dimethylallyltransferase